MRRCSNLLRGSCVLLLVALPFERSAASGPGTPKETKKTAANWAIRYHQGFNMKVWMNNELRFGIDVAPSLSEIGLEYPAGSGNEHLYVGGPIVAGIVNGNKQVSPAWWFGSQEFIPELKDTARNPFWITSAADSSVDSSRVGFYKASMNRREYDDDGDGKVDEDELDGDDNDGDWVEATDDVGRDGIPDTLEHGCNGGYNAALNPDPAEDNFDPAKVDPCHPGPGGALSRKGDRSLYTERNGIPDHGEPHVDEDFGAVSDNDVYCTVTDTFSYPPLSFHVPLGIKVFQKSYAWKGDYADGILPFDYTIVNVGRNVIDGVYLGWLGDLDVGPVSYPNYYGFDYAAYLPELHTAFMHNAAVRGSTPLGVTILSTSKPLPQLNFTFQWFDLANTPSTDPLQYDWLSCAAFGPGQCIKPNQSPQDLNDTRIFVAFGPFGQMNPGDTLRLSLAFVSGSGLTDGPGNLVDNIKKTIRIFAGGFRTPVLPVSPCLEATAAYKSIRLNWASTVRCPVGPRIDPFSVWDDSSKTAELYPPDHWRRVNPPAGHPRGGRIFEGYRLYRSEDPSGNASTFTLVKQYDLADEFSFNQGIDSAFTDTNLVRGRRYWYAVTSIGIPNYTLLPVDGGGAPDTLWSELPESAIDANKFAVDLTFSVSSQPGEVLAVPNPYRIDRDYSFESGGWEGRSRDWTENNRTLKFIHLPAKCTVRVFTLAGDQVASLDHDDPVRGELEWDLLSESHRALASGVYIFTVESDLGKQIGKFVLIR